MVDYLFVNGKATTSHEIYWDNHFLQKFSPPPVWSMLMGLQITLRPCCRQITDPQHWCRGGGQGLNGAIFKFF